MERLLERRKEQLGLGAVLGEPLTGFALKGGEMGQQLEGGRRGTHRCRAGETCCGDVLGWRLDSAGARAPHAQKQERGETVHRCSWRVSGASGNFFFFFCLVKYVYRKAHQTHIYHFMNDVGTYVTTTGGKKKKKTRKRLLTPNKIKHIPTPL